MRANVDLPEPDAPTSTTSDELGDLERRRALIARTPPSASARRPRRPPGRPAGSARRSRARPATRPAQPSNSARVHSKRWSRWRNSPAGRPSNSTLYSPFGVVTTTVAGRACSNTTRSNAAQPRRVEVLDHLDDRGRVEAGEPAVAVGQRRLEQLDPLALPRRQPVELQPRSARSRAPRYEMSMPTICSNDGSSSSARSSLPSPQPRSSTLVGAARPQRGDDRAEPLLVAGSSAPRPPPPRPRARRCVVVGVGLLVGEQLVERRARERALVLEVAVARSARARDAPQPALAAAQQLLDLVVADPVVLLASSTGIEHVEVREQVAQPHVAAQVDGVVPARRPTRGSARRAGAAPRRPRSRAARTAGAAISSPPRTAATASRASSGSGLVGQLGPRLAPAGQRGAEHPRDRDAQERRRDVRPVVDVLVEPREAARRGGSARPGRRRAAARPCSARRSPRDRRRAPRRTRSSNRCTRSGCLWSR